METNRKEYSEEDLKMFAAYHGVRVSNVWQKEPVDKHFAEWKQSRQPEKDWRNEKLVETHGGVTCGSLGCKIHSVKRLSDGEIFSVGDTVNSVWNIQEIKSFEIIDGDMVAVFSTCRSPLSMLSKRPKPPQPKALFVTEDGVEVFAGMESWYISDDFNVRTTGKLCSSDNNNYRLKHFSTREKAEDWVAWNKVTLSMTDLMANTSMVSINGERTFYPDEILKKIKSKLSK